MKRFDSFTDFVLHFVKILFCVIVIFPIVLAPILLMIIEMKWIPFPVSPYVFIMDPFAAIDFQMKISRILLQIIKLAGDMTINI